MKYSYLNLKIPTSKRAEYNKKILHLINSGDLQGLTKGDIFNAYTGRGGLHQLNSSDFSNYYEFAKMKKGFEIGQFFTPPNLCEIMVNFISPAFSDIIADLTCGIGNFFNYCPVEKNLYGCEVDGDVVKVAKFLYPEANIVRKDIRDYNPDVKFDIVFGNPPFNLDFCECLSQFYYCLKAADLLRPAGLLVLIVPKSFLADDFLDKGDIDFINQYFSFVCQIRLSPDSFKIFGVEHFETKILILQKHCESLESKPYKHDQFASGSLEEIHKDYIEPVLRAKQNARSKILLEFQREKAKNTFDYRICKYLYQIKINKKTAPEYGKCLAKLEELKTQEKPAYMADKEWEKSKITEAKVLSYLKRILKKQHYKEIDKIALVKNKYQYRIKAYSLKTQKELKNNSQKAIWNINDSILNGINGDSISTLGLDLAFIKKTIERKKETFLLQSQPLKSLERNPLIDSFIDEFFFLNKDGQACKFNQMQKKDLGLVMIKSYSILNWQQGSGKTAAAWGWAKYNIKYRHSRNAFIVGPALGINLTWDPFLTINNESFVKILKVGDIDRIQPGQFVIISLNMLIKFQKYISRFIKKQSQKVCLVFDESDESTNHNAKRSRAVLHCFSRVRQKLLTTGTTTRNNISELYTQLELLYNNSINLLCECRNIYQAVKDKEIGTIEIKEKRNEDYFMKPFPARYGNNLFKACFNPMKTTVFGIKKHNQDLFNSEELSKIIEKTIITRKFKDIVGPDKYSIHSHRVRQNRNEEYVYSKIINELMELIPQYFRNTGNDNKEAMLQIIRQIQLLIKATSIPHSFKEYNMGQSSLFSSFTCKPPNKFIKVLELVKSFENLKVAIGCTTIEATMYYYNKLRQLLPGRSSFLIKGDVNFRERNEIIKEFEDTSDGILVSTQQSLKSSISIPSCQRVIIESLQWNIPKIEQFFFRFIRYDSPHHVQVHFVNYQNTIEINLLAMVLVKERLNEFIKTLEIKEQSDIFDEYDLDQNLLDFLLKKCKDQEGKTCINWGSQAVQ